MTRRASPAATEAAVPQAQEVSATPVALTVSDTVATITLNRPEAGNSINQPMADALLDAAIRCDNDTAIRCVVLTGAGKLFCGGGDIGSFVSAGPEIPAYLGRLVGTLHQAELKLMRMAKPLLVLVNGPAAGAGMSLAMCGDIVIASERASFTPAYGSVGLSADGGMTWFLPRHVGLRRAQDIILSNRRVPAREAAEIGLITRVVPDEDLVREGTSTAQALASAATGAVGAVRNLLLDSSCSSLEAQLEREARAMATAGGSDDCREGLQALSESRAPNFTGKA